MLDKICDLNKALPASTINNWKIVEAKFYCPHAFGLPMAISIFEQGDYTRTHLHSITVPITSLYHFCKHEFDISKHNKAERFHTLNE